MQEYADPVIDWLDGGRGILSRRFFREVRQAKCSLYLRLTSMAQSCTQLPNGSYAKDLSQVDPDLSRVCLLDNSPASYSVDQGSLVLFRIC
jgi:CTD nuclear envelope phosphatase 1